MNRSKSAIVTTACLGMAVGTAAYVMSGRRSRARRMKRATERAIRQAGEIISHILS